VIIDGASVMSVTDLGYSFDKNRKPYHLGLRLEVHADLIDNFWNLNKAGHLILEERIPIEEHEYYNGGVNESNLLVIYAEANSNGLTLYPESVLLFNARVGRYAMFKVRLSQQDSDLLLDVINNHLR
jgi:hypothetical protein